MAQQHIPQSIVLDAAALGEAAREGAQLRPQLRRAVARGAQVHTTATAVTEVLRGDPRDANINRLLSALSIRAVDERIGRAAGLRIGRSRLCGNVSLDAVIAELASALPRPVVVFTADDGELRALVDAHVLVLDVAA